MDGLPFVAAAPEGEQMRMGTKKPRRERANGAQSTEALRGQRCFRTESICCLGQGSAARGMRERGRGRNARLCSEPGG
jgi:hypothetical protein